MTSKPNTHMKRWLSHHPRKAKAFQPARRSLSCILVAAVALLLALAGCSDDSTSTTSSSTPASATESAGCADVAALQTSLESLKDVNVQQDGAEALNSAIADVKTDVDAAAASASNALQPEVEQVKTAFDGLQTAATGLTADNLVDKAPAIVTALTQVESATTALASTVSQSCPES
jgi:hypothetical protein